MLFLDSHISYQPSMNVSTQASEFNLVFHTITNFPTDIAIAYCVSAERLVSLGVRLRRLTQPPRSTSSILSSFMSTPSATPSTNMMRECVPPERTHQPTPRIKRVC